MSEPTVIPPRTGEVIGDAPDRRVEILSDAAPLAATWSRFGPGRDGADLHVHHHHTDLFYVLEGEFTARLGPEGDEHALPPGTLTRIPPDVVHGFRNASSVEMRYLNLHAPGRGFAEYMRGLRDGAPVDFFDQHDPPADGGRPVSLAVVGHRETVVDRPGLQVDLLADADEVAVAEVRLDGKAPGATHDHLVSYYVLDGELALGDTTLAAGTWAQVPAGLPHALAGVGRYLEIHTPGGGAFSS
ncbi:MAG: cupin domain-containing protein [Solirubrobacterales bacterium]|nr:cupin domain-containing protein [Solirubrobacterales bacterium]